MLANFSNLITFSRGSNATVVGPNGLVQWAPSNLLTFSEQFDNAAWVTGLPSPAPVTANTFAAPDGTTTADTIAPALATPSRRNQSSVTSGATYTASIWVRAAPSGSATHFRITSNNTVAWNTGASTKVALTTSWQRVSVTWTQSGSSLANIVIGASDVAGVNDADCYGNVLVWGAQLELGSAATTYNPTSVKNLLGFSEAFDNAAWTKGGASIVTGAQANPVNGLFNAQKLMENTAAATNHYVQQILGSLNAGKPITLSVYAKAGERRYIGLLEGYSNKGQYFDLQTGTVGGVLSGAPTSASITAVGNGWYRCTITTSVLSATASLEVYLSNTGATISYTGDGNSGIYIYGAQLSDSASLDPYVPTPGAAPSSTAYYGPRFDYDPVTLAPKGILIEEQRTNLLTLSENIAGAAWFVVNIASRTANTSTSPSGTVTAGTLTDDTTTARHVLYNTITLGSSGVYTFSVYLKQGTGRYVQVQLSAGSSATSIGVIADLLNGTITDTKIGASATNTASSITSFGNGWYRVSVTCQCASGTVYPIIAGSDSATPTYDAFFNPTYTGTGQTRLIWGAQLEAGAFATSYIPTVASQVTRTADVAQITGSLFSQWYNGSEGTLVADVQKLSTSASAPYAWELIGASSNFSMRVRLGADSRMQSVDGGAVQADAQLATPVLTTPAKYAMAYRLNDYAGSTGGAAVATDTSGTVPAVTTLSIGSAAVANVYVRNITYIPNRISNDQLQAATS